MSLSHDDTLRPYSMPAAEPAFSARSNRDRAALGELSHELRICLSGSAGGVVGGSVGLVYGRRVGYRHEADAQFRARTHLSTHP